VRAGDGNVPHVMRYFAGLMAFLPSQMTCLERIDSELIQSLLLQERLEAKRYKPCFDISSLVGQEQVHQAALRIRG
jgi:hypothetical protein